MSQKFEVKVRATKPHQYAIGGKYKLVFGNPVFQEKNASCPYLFHCLRLDSIIYNPAGGDPAWIYAGIGEFDDNIWRVISEVLKTEPQGVS